MTKQTKPKEEKTGLHEGEEFIANMGDKMKLEAGTLVLVQSTKEMKKKP